MPEEHNNLTMVLFTALLSYHLADLVARALWVAGWLA